MFSTDNELLEVVDEYDRIIDIAARRQIHAEGLMHRAVYIFLFNEAGAIYVQRRSADKDRHPLTLDSSAAGHVDPGESYRVAATRELLEELGVTGALTEQLKIAASTLTDNEHVVLYTIVSSVEPRPNPEEILSGEFVAADELTRRMESRPEDYVPAFLLLWRRFQGIAR